MHPHSLLPHQPRSNMWIRSSQVVLIFGLLLQAITVRAVELQQKTVDAWNQYTTTLRSRIEQNLTAGGALPSRTVITATARIEAGAVVVTSAGPNPKHVPGGLIHDWQGTVFIPDTDMNAVLATVRDYGAYRLFYPNVLESRTVATSEASDRFLLVLANRSLISGTALKGEYRSVYYRVSPTECYSISESARIEEIKGYGTQWERVLSADEGSGFIWRLLSITRYQQRDGGVYVELEAVALSRDMPQALRWAIGPIVRRVSRDSVTASLRQTRAAVESRNSSLSHAAETTHAAAHGIPAAAFIK